MQTGSYLAQGYRAHEYCQNQGLLPAPDPGVWPCLHGIGPYGEQLIGTELQEPSLQNIFYEHRIKKHTDKPKQRLDTILNSQVI